MSATKNVWLWWSSGKDSAWALHKLRQDPSRRVTALVTTLTDPFDRVAMHGVRSSILRRQAQLAGLPLHEMRISYPCPNGAYEQAVQPVLAAAEAQGIHEMAFGDLFLEDIRRYREQLFVSSEIEPIFPLWGLDTAELAADMVSAGLDARIVCLDPKALPEAMIGRSFAEALEDLPKGVDPCGENGEMHTCVVAGPMFSDRLNVILGEVVNREGFVFGDLDLIDT